MIRKCSWVSKYLDEKYLEIFVQGQFWKVIGMCNGNEFGLGDGVYVTRV